ncbi:MAG: winged helix family transcriptional regulator, partial [Sphingobacteriales bacterium]
TQKIILTARELALLEFFMKNQNKALSRNEITEKVWDVNFDTGTNVVDVYVNYLRKKIDKDFSPKLIHTITGIGYIMQESEE